MLDPNNPKHAAAINAANSILLKLKDGTQAATEAANQLGQAFEKIRPDLLQMPFAVQCSTCSEWQPMGITYGEFEEWIASDTLVQNHFPDMSADKRELLISQTCGACFNEMFPEE